MFRLVSCFVFRVSCFRFAQSSQHARSDAELALTGATAALASFRHQLAESAAHADRMQLALDASHQVCVSVCMAVGSC